MRPRKSRLLEKMAERKMENRLLPNWPDSFPKLLNIKPEPLEGYIEERIIYRKALDSERIEKHAEFYISKEGIYFYLDTLGKQHEWNILSYNEYLEEYQIIYERVKKFGIPRTAITSMKIEIYDEVSRIVPIKLIMELEPSPKE
jgi:hypothetical protein